MNESRWWKKGLAALCFVASVAAPGFVGDAHAAFVDCTLCHLDPVPGSQARDYVDYFVTPQRQHHSGIVYPPAGNREFFRPTSSLDGVAFFDRNANGVADADEVQLFGAGARVECASCHREHGDAAPTADPVMYLRMAPAVLCLVCHRV